MWQQSDHDFPLCSGSQLTTLTQIQAWEQEKDKESLTTKGAINLIPYAMEKPASQKPSCWLVSSSVKTKPSSSSSSPHEKGRKMTSFKFSPTHTLVTLYLLESSKAVKCNLCGCTSCRMSLSSAKINAKLSHSCLGCYWLALFLMTNNQGSSHMFSHTRKLEREKGLHEKEKWDQ